MHGHMTVVTEKGAFITTEYETFVMEDILADIREAVGGHIELIPYWDSYNSNRSIAFCNEDGKNLGLQRNVTATALWDKILVTKNMTRFKDGVEIDYLVGSIAIMTGDDGFMTEMTT